MMNVTEIRKPIFLEGIRKHLQQSVIQSVAKLIF